MEIQKGSLVYSKAGKDKGKLFLVLKTEGELAYIADGETRLVQKPKMKKFKHLQKTNTIVEIKTELENFEVRKILTGFKTK